jgi:long-chain fatty acid transport protein
MKFNRFLMTTLGALTAFLSQSSNAEALAASVKTFGMAATGVAYPQDAMAVAYNPAGMARVGDRIDMGIHWAHDKGHAKVGGNQIPTLNGFYSGYKTHNFYSPEFGINKCFGCENEWSIGLAVYNRNQSKTTYNKPFALIGNTNLGLDYVHETISPVVAYRLNDCHTFGVSVNYNIQRAKANGIQNFDNALRSAHPGKVTNKGYAWSTGWGVTLGWQWRIIDTLTIGLTYQPKTPMAKLSKYKGFFADGGKFDIPQVASAGIAWRFVECATVAFDVQYYDWSQIKALHNKLLHDGHVELLGSKNGPGFGWRSQIFYRVGFDYAWSESLILRAGFRHSNAIIPNSQTVVNQLSLDTVQDYITTGFTYMLNDCQEISSYFAYGIPKKIHGKNSIPAGLPPEGFGGGNSDITQQKYAVGISWGMNY